MAFFILHQFRIFLLAKILGKNIIYFSSFSWIFPDDPVALQVPFSYYRFACIYLEAS